MKCRLVKIESLSGKKASIYSIVLSDKDDNFAKYSLLELFLKEFSLSFRNETIDILKRLKSIGHSVGAEEHFFKTKEGKPGDGVCALYDKPNSNLRLYCIRFGKGVLIVGSGGFKSKSIRSFQDDVTLKNTNYFLRALSSYMAELMQFKELAFSESEIELEGDFEFDLDIDI